MSVRVVFRFNFVVHYMCGASNDLCLVFVKVLYRYEIWNSPGNNRHTVNSERKKICVRTAKNSQTKMPRTTTQIIAYTYNVYESVQAQAKGRYMPWNRMARTRKHEILSMEWRTAKMLRCGRMKHFLFAQNARKSVTRFILIRAEFFFFFCCCCSLSTDKNVIISVYSVVQVGFIAILATIIVHNNNIVPRTQAQLLLLIDFHRSLHQIMKKGFRYAALKQQKEMQQNAQHIVQSTDGVLIRFSGNELKSETSFVLAVANSRAGR